MDKNFSLFRKEALEHIASLDKHDKCLAIITVKSWMIMLSVYLVLLMVILWGFFGSIRTSIDSHGFLVASSVSNYPSQLVAYAFISDEQALQIKRGMKALITLANSGNQAFEGEVKEVNPFSLKKEEIISKINENNLSEMLVEKGKLSVIAIDVRNKQKSGSGMLLSRTQEGARLTKGHPVRVTVVLDEQSPVELMIPMFQKI